MMCLVFQGSKSETDKYFYGSTGFLCLISEGNTMRKALHVTSLIISYFSQATKYDFPSIKRTSLSPERKCLYSRFFLLLFSNHHLLSDIRFTVQQSVFGRARTGSTGYRSGTHARVRTHRSVRQICMIKARDYTQPTREKKRQLLGNKREKKELWFQSGFSLLFLSV